MFNGRFLSAKPSGVQRVARAFIETIESHLRSRTSGAQEFSLLCPHNADRPIDLTAIQRRTVGRLSSHAWEQIELPLAAKNGLLVNLCNLAPLASRGGITMIHDAQVFLTPDSNSKLFGAWYRFALPRIGANAARILTVSEFSRQKLIEYKVAPAERINVIHNGADHLMGVTSDPAVIDQLDLRDRPYVLAAANTQHHKNIALLFEVMQRPEMRGQTLVLAGPHDAEAFTLAGHPPPPGVIFAGHVTDGALRALYEHAVCLAFPSTTEGFGLPPLEAMGLGCPAVVAPRGALPEVCGDAALYREPEDAAGWAEAILALVNSSALRLETRALGLNQAAKFRWTDMAHRMLTIIEDVA